MNKSPSKKEVKVSELNSITIRFAGDSGDGIQLVGSQFADIASLVGNALSTMPDYPSDIRAPAASRAGAPRYPLLGRDELVAAAQQAAAAGGSSRATLEDLYRQIQAGQAKELRLILKADVSGSLGAISHALGQLSTDEVKINVLLEAAGDITDNDILLASASNAIVVGFSTKITETARRAAVSEGVDVRLYDIIYQLVDDVSKALKGLLEPTFVEVIEGRAEVRAVFPVKAPAPSTVLR